MTSCTVQYAYAAELDLAASQGHHVSLSYTNITNARVYLLLDLDPSSLDPPYPHVFYLNNASRNKLAFACPDQNSLISILSAIRLAIWESGSGFGAPSLIKTTYTVVEEAWSQFRVTGRVFEAREQEGRERGAERGFCWILLDFEEERVAVEGNGWRHWKEWQKLDGGAHQGPSGWSKTTGAMDL
ncbi:hypothetical protein PPACK8108_LOCUS21176 [Phakopsora pachyrhizi]|uniref:Uncharacterized protein n=1 Tax=Phakopsora pachyrhizi TaxID=170000 RepID=A0AAV0BIX2_PHAPC|nr:hypothetical protein PPACK8108_LOCUS21176 [Phakopsora pachyrhizi]